MATVGKTSDGTNVQTFSEDRIYLSTATPSSGGTLTGGGGRIRVTTAGSFGSKLVVYSDLVGVPLTFLAVSDELIVDWTTSTDSVWTFSGANQITLVSGTPYWFGFWSDDPGTPSYEYKRDNTAGVNQFAAEVYPGSGSPASPWVSGGTANGPLNCYLTYTEPSGRTNKLMTLGVG